MRSARADDERELADAILTGAKRRPTQSFGDYFGPEGGSCALGAAYEGIYMLPSQMEGEHPDRLDRFFHCIDETSRRCPAGCRKQVPIGALIVHLNDDHRWTREQIAAWLRGEITPGRRADEASSPDATRRQTAGEGTIRGATERQEPADESSSDATSS